MFSGKTMEKALATLPANQPRMSVMELSQTFIYSRGPRNCPYHSSKDNEGHPPHTSYPQYRMVLLCKKLNPPGFSEDENAACMGCGSGRVGKAAMGSNAEELPWLGGSGTWWELPLPVVLWMPPVAKKDVMFH